jgi:hypothetical protein
MSKILIFSFLIFTCQISAGAPLFTPSIDPARGNASALEWLGGSQVAWKNSYAMQYSSWGSGSVSQGLYVSNLLFQWSPKFKMGFEMGLSNIFQASGSDYFGNEYRGVSDKPSFVLPRISMQYDFSKNFRVVGVVDLSGGSCYSNHGYSGYRSQYMGLNCSAYDRSSFDSFGIDQ